MRVPYRPDRAPDAEPRAARFYAHLDQRRSVRDFSPEPVPRAVIEHAIRAASTAPSGAHRQPWTFVAISNPALKHQIRLATEAEEQESYARRMPQEWKDALEPLGTDWQKPYLDVVPWIVVLFAQLWGTAPDGTKRKHYYVPESCGIAAGLFIAALHEAGVATLTHTPAPMRYLTELLGRPDNEKPMILFPIGYPAADCTVPDLVRKPLDEVSVWLE